MKRSNSEIKTSCFEDNAARVRYLFHPQEIAFCGYSGSGKTTLITRILEMFSRTYNVGYIKHDSHSFEMDIKGKDTFVARDKGAKMVLVNDSGHWAFIANGQMNSGAIRTLYAPMDMVFVEGYKNSTLPKIVVIDQYGKILEDIDEGKIDNVVLCVGMSDSHSCCKYPYCNRNDIQKIAGFIMARFGLMV